MTSDPYSELSGVKVIANYVDALPNKPGVYRMLDEGGSVLYIGKARALKKRVVSYTRIQALPIRIQRMVTATRAMEFILTNTETEALLLEANLIKTMKPRYNVLLRDDKSFPYIRINKDHPAPQLLKHRGARKAGSSYFGPFASAGAVNDTISALQRAFMLRTCTDNVYETRSRPCLQFQIKRCSAPCTGEISLDHYQDYVAQAEACLQGKSQAIQTRLTEAMEQASQDMAYEKAIILRDRLAALARIQSHQTINSQRLKAADIFGLSQQGGRTAIQVFFYRAWQNWGNRTYYPRAEKSLDGAAVLGPFLAQFYLNKPVPRMILLPFPVEDQDLLEKALSERAGYRVRILVPQRGEKRAILDNANHNAREALARQLADTASQKALLESLQSFLERSEPLQRVEIYDNSHHAGSDMLGAMVVVGQSGFVRQAYRKFNLRDESRAPGDDFGMMKEMLTRRFSRLIKDRALGKGVERGESRGEETDDSEEAALPEWPDLLIIDGGKGQLSVVEESLEALGLGDQLVMAVSKGPDRNAGREVIHRRGHEPVLLQANDPLLYFIQRLRDEAHRFVIGGQRKRRTATLYKSDLDEISGVGQSRKRALLRHFGSVNGIKGAGLSDLKRVPGIDQQTAERIYAFFQDPTH